MNLNICSCTNKGNISFNVIKHCFRSSYKPLLHIFNLSLEQGIFPEEYKIARVTPKCLISDKQNLGNNKLISVLPCLSKIPQQIMYNRRDKYVIKKYTAQETV